MQKTHDDVITYFRFRPTRSKIAYSRMHNVAEKTARLEEMYNAIMMLHNVVPISKARYSSQIVKLFVLLSMWKDRTIPFFSLERALRKLSLDNSNIPNTIDHPFVIGFTEHEYVLIKLTNASQYLTNIDKS